MSEPTVKTYATRSGPMLALRTDHYMAQSLETYGEYCPDEWRLLKQLIKPGMTVVEMGANIGAHSVDMAKACAPGPFYAFEPQPRLFQILCANLAMNDVDNALAYPEACGEAEGWAVVPPYDYTKPANFGGVALEEPGTRGVKVRVVPLDSLELELCHLLKIDVEGFEPMALRGARATIALCRPVIYIENDRAGQQQEVIHLLTEMGYRLYWDTPRLFSENNFKGVLDNIFGATLSVNMLCIPAERTTHVAGSEPVDPANWRSPVELRR